MKLNKRADRKPINKYRYSTSEHVSTVAPLDAHIDLTCRLVLKQSWHEGPDDDAVVGGVLVVEPADGGGAAETHTVLYKVPPLRPEVEAQAWLVAPTGVHREGVKR